LFWYFHVFNFLSIFGLMNILFLKTIVKYFLHKFEYYF